MTHPVLKKLEFFGPLPVNDRAVIEGILTREEDVAANVDLIREGDDPSVVHLNHGRLCLPLQKAGRWQATDRSVYGAGDFADPYAFILKTMDHSISTLERSKVVRVSR